MPNATFFTRLAAGLLALLPIGLQAQQLDPTFHPPHFVDSAGNGAPYIQKVLRQADGRYLVLGTFQSVDGHVTAGLARLLPNGHVDTTFAYHPGTTTPWGNYPALAVQPDGKVLLPSLSNGQQTSIVRLLPSGQPDSTYRVVLPQRLSSSGRFRFGQMIMQPDGKVLLGGFYSDSLSMGLLRLLPSGQVDSTFTPPPTMPLPTIVLLEPNGRIVYASSSFWYNSPGSQMGRLLASGRPDSSFTYSPQPNVRISLLARCPDGRYAVGGALGFSTQRFATGRLLATGAWDASYPLSLSGSGVGPPTSIPVYIRAIAVQADGRILAGGQMSSEVLSIANTAGLVRAQLHGGLDTSFDANFIHHSSPYSISNVAYVVDLLMEPGDKLMVAGRFEQAGGVPHWGLARLMPAAPLATSPARNTAPLEVWPVPAHGELHVQLPTAQVAQQVELLDATGRRVLTQQARTTALTLNTATLPTGLYVLLVRYTDGTAATRRVVLE